MSLADIVRQAAAPDIAALEKKKDIRGLVNLLSKSDYRVRNQAADALGRIGTPAISALNYRAGHGDVVTRLGIVEAMTRIRSPGSIPVLIRILADDPSNEMRWIAAIALGEVGDTGNIPHLLRALEDRDKYVRYGSARSLERLGWRPQNEEDKVKLRVCLQEWSAIPGIGHVPTGVLLKYFDDPDPRIRASVVTVLGMVGDPRADEVCDRALGDPDPEVRWKASLAFPLCRVPTLYLPGGFSRRVRARKSIFGAMVLNFFFLGLGYNYLGKWWGFLLFQINLNTVVVLTLVYGTVVPYLLSYTVSCAAVIHTWYIGRGMPDI